MSNCLTQSWDKGPSYGSHHVFAAILSYLKWSDCCETVSMTWVLITTPTIMVMKWIVVPTNRFVIWATLIAVRLLAWQLVLLWFGIFRIVAGCSQIVIFTCTSRIQQNRFCLYTFNRIKGLLDSIMTLSGIIARVSGHFPEE